MTDPNVDIVAATAANSTEWIQTSLGHYNAQSENHGDPDPALSAYLQRRQAAVHDAHINQQLEKLEQLCTKSPPPFRFNLPFYPGRLVGRLVGRLARLVALRRF